MATIDRYLLRHFFWVFFIFYVSFLGLFIVTDCVNNFEELSVYAKTNGGMLKVMTTYYGNRALVFFNNMSPLLILAAAMFTIAAFRRHNEMTALMAAGITKSRIVRPIILAAIVLTLLAATNRELVMPQAREALSFNAQDLNPANLRDITPRYDMQTDILLGGEGVLRKNKRVVRPNFFLPKSLEQYGPQLLAEEAVYVPPSGGRPSGYLLSEVKRPEGLDNKPSLTLRGAPVLITPRDADWLQPGQCFVVSGVNFEQLSGGNAWRKFSSTRELIAGLDNPSLDHGQNVHVQIHSRFVQPLLDLTLLFLGLPLVLSRSTHNLFVSVGLCVLLVIAFMLVVVGCHHLGAHSTLNPALAAWAPLLIFVPVALGLAEPLLE